VTLADAEGTSEGARSAAHRAAELRRLTRRQLLVRSRQYGAAALRARPRLSVTSFHLSSVDMRDSMTYVLHA
jgi:hypothetical protein